MAEFVDRDFLKLKQFGYSYICMSVVAQFFRVLQYYGVDDTSSNGIEILSLFFLYKAIKELNLLTNRETNLMKNFKFYLISALVAIIFIVWFYISISKENLNLTTIISTFSISIISLVAFLIFYYKIFSEFSTILNDNLFRLSAILSILYIPMIFAIGFLVQVNDMFLKIEPIFDVLGFVPYVILAYAFKRIKGVF